ncbi:hypothetical protein GCM10027452_29400 [Micromonospora halotolerans]
MIEVLMVMGTVPGRVAVLTDALEQFRAKGVTVRVATTFDPVEKISAATSAGRRSPLPARVAG